MIARAHLWKKPDALQTLGLEYRHDRLDHRVMLTTERLVLQGSQEGVNDHRLVIVIRTGGSSVTDWRRGCGIGFQFVEGLSLEDEWCELRYTGVQ